MCSGRRLMYLLRMEVKLSTIDRQGMQHIRNRLKRMLGGGLCRWPSPCVLVDSAIVSGVWRESGESGESQVQSTAVGCCPGARSGRLTMSTCLLAPLLASCLRILNAIAQ